jgi:hypothetical protein
VFDQTTRLPNGRNLGSHSHKQATGWKSSRTTPHTHAERRLKTMNSGIAQQWRRTPRPPHGLYVGTVIQFKDSTHPSPRRLHPGFIAVAHARPHTVHDPSLPRTNATTRRPRSSRHEPLLSTRLGHPLDCASCRTYRLMPSLLDLIVDPDRLLRSAQKPAAPTLLPAGSAAQNAATPTRAPRCTPTHARTCATATRSTPDAAAGLDAHHRELQLLLHDACTDTASSTPRRATDGSQTRPTCTHTDHGHEHTT